MTHEQRQQRELERCQIDRDAVAARLTCVEVDGEIAHLDERCRCLAAAATHCPDAGEQLVEAEGLREVVIRAGIEPGDLVAGLAQRREHDDREVAAAAPQGAADLLSVELGEHEVEDGEIERSALRQPKAAAAILRDGHVVPLVGESGPQEFDDPRLVLDHEDPQRGGTRSVSVDPTAGGVHMQQ